MNFFWLICILSGILCLVAAWRNWGWFFFHRFARTVASLLGRTAARIVYAALGVFLLVTGLYLGRNDGWALTEPFGCRVVVTGVYAGADARTVATALAGPVDSECSELWAKFVLSESRGDGSYRASVVFPPTVKPEVAKVEVVNAITAFSASLPKTVELTINLEPPPRTGGHVALAVVGKTDEVNETALADLAHAVEQRLVDEHSLVDPLSLEEQFPPHGAAPALVVIVNRRPAARILGLPPSGKSVPWAALRCLALAESERKKRPDHDDFEIVNLGTL